LTAAISGEELVLVLGAYSALVLGAFGMLIKFVLDTRKQTVETNRAVNNRPSSEPTLRALVESIDERVDSLRGQSRDWHQSNVRRIDRLADAVGGVNRRLDAIETRVQREQREQGDT
jgi:hypothetical protein